ncbi:M61 family metallopeptidase [Paraglaciecola sp.]|uniref:M61 family metallopeptidase n=1 Tax=Paraglaciecola sp. TaxID=1920173 RepID=UPI003EF93C8C
MQKSKSNVHYQVSVKSITSHEFNVTLSIENPDKTGQLLSLPAWIPGSYMIRDFAKNIIQISAFNAAGEILNITKQDKQTWRVSPCIGKLTIEYQVYAYDLSVRGAYINDEYAFFNGTNMFLAVEGQTSQPCSVELIKPKENTLSHWKVATTLTSNKHLSHEFGHYWAKHYDELIDHPVLLGEFDIVPFETSGVKFELILAGGHQADTNRIKSDLTKICQHQIEFFKDSPPIGHYQFITLLTDNAFGGLEHISSTALMYSRKDLPSLYQKENMTDGYQTFLSLCSHEFLHTWHVKRTKPEELFEAKLDCEKYTEQLWIYEGFTSYYDDLSLLRCGVVKQEEYLNVMAKNLTRLVRNKGRFKQSITESSYDAWTKFYKQDESSINNIVSYYNKGAVLAMCLDLLIKQKTDNKQTLDDVMRYLWAQYGKLGIPTHKLSVQKIVADDLNIDLSDFFELALYTTQELPFEKLLSQFGINVNYSARDKLGDKGGSISTTPFMFDFGAQLKDKDIGVEVLQVTQPSASFNAGLQVKDVIIAINNWQISTDNLKYIINNLELKQQVPLTILRDKKLKNLSFTAERVVLDSIHLSVNDVEKCQSWLA